MNTYIRTSTLHDNITKDNMAHRVAALHAVVKAKNKNFPQHNALLAGINEIHYYIKLYFSKNSVLD